MAFSTTFPGLLLAYFLVRGVPRDFLRLAELVVTIGGSKGSWFKAFIAFCSRPNRFLEVASQSPIGKCPTICLIYPLYTSRTRWSRPANTGGVAEERVAYAGNRATLKVSGSGIDGSTSRALGSSLI